MIVSIKATADASQRTKNRIKERGPEFVVERKHTNAAFSLKGEAQLETWLLREVGGPDGDTWLGWLNVKEFEIVKESDWHNRKTLINLKNIRD